MYMHEVRGDGFLWRNILFLKQSLLEVKTAKKRPSTGINNVTLTLRNNNRV